MSAPTLTPHKALQMLRAKDDICVDGIFYSLDGPMGCPSSAMHPVAYAANPDIQWFPAGEIGDEITEMTVWIKTIDGEIVSG